MTKIEARRSRKELEKNFFGRNVMISQVISLVYATPSPAACASLRRNRCTASLVWHHGARLACGCGCGAESMPLLCRSVAKSTRPAETEKTVKPTNTSRLPPFLCMNVCATRPRWPVVAAAFPMRWYWCASTAPDL